MPCFWRNTKLIFCYVTNLQVLYYETLYLPAPEFDILWITVAMDELIFSAHPNCYTLFLVIISSKLVLLFSVQLSWWRTDFVSATVFYQWQISIFSQMWTGCFLPIVWVLETRGIELTVVVAVKIFGYSVAYFQILSVGEILLLASQSSQFYETAIARLRFRASCIVRVSVVLCQLWIDG